MRALTRMLLFLVLVAGAASAEPVRLSAQAFGAQAEIEIRDLAREAADSAARAALEEIFDLSQLFDPKGDLPGSVGLLNAAAGQQASLPLEARVGELLRRGLQYCLWTNGVHGPVGGELYRLWNSGSEGQVPHPSALRTAVINADCRRLTLTFAVPDFSARLTAGSQINAVGMQRGYALDRAVEILKQAGVDNAWLQLGGVWRGIGGGPEGEGWLAHLPPVPGTKEPMDRVWLRNQSLAIASIEPVGGETAIRYIDQRTGVPGRGVVAVAAVTELAMDAEALAATLFIEGLRGGQMRLGTLKPRPSVLWLLGQGKGTPVQSTYRWSELARERHRRRD